MPTLIVNRMRRFIPLALLCWISACSEQPEFQKSNAETKLETVEVFDPAALNLGSLISYDLYAEANKLHLLFAANSAAGAAQPVYIGYSYSEDGGHHWSPAQQLEQPSVGRLESHNGNDLQIAASGANLLAVWQKTGEIPGMGPLQAQYSLDGGKTWAAGANPTGAETDQSHADLLADKVGRFHLVWLDDRDENGYQGLRYARSSDTGRRWEYAQTIDESSCSCCWNRLAPGPAYQIYTLYRDMEPRDMALVKSSDNGQTWRRLNRVGAFDWIFDGCPHNGGAFSIAGDKAHALVWTGAEQRIGLYYLSSSNGGVSWSEPLAMGKPQAAFHSDLAHRDERLLAVWDELGEQGSEIKAALSTTGGRQWLPLNTLSAPEHKAGFPRAVATASGFFAVWTDQAPGGDKRLAALIIQ